MPTSTTAWGRIVGLVLACLLFLTQSAGAQTAPAWVNPQANRAYFSPYPHRVFDAAGNLYEVGTFYTATNVADTKLTSHGSYDGYLAKYTPTGSLAWVHQFGSDGEDQAADVAIDAAGNAYVVGTFSNAIDLGAGQRLDAGSYVGRKAFVIKYDPAGTPLWAQQNTAYPASTGPICPPGGYAYAVQVDAAGTLSVTGSYGLATAFGFGSLKLESPISANNSILMPIFLARFSAATGEPQSIFPVLYSDRSTGAGVIYPQQILSAPTGGTYLVTQYYMAPSFVTGLSFPAPTSVNILAAKYSATGKLEWAHTFGGPDFDNVAQAATDAAGNLYLTGSFRESLTFGTTTLTGSGSGNDDGYLVKYSPQGIEQWAQALASAGADFLTALCLDAAGNVYVTGGFGNQAHIGNATLTSAGQSDVVVAAYTPQGRLSWVQQAGGTDEDRGLSVGFTSQGRLRVFGYTGYQASFGTTSIYNSSYGGFVAELGSLPLATAAAQVLPLGVYPNPASTQVYLPSLSAGSYVQIADVLGRPARLAQVMPGATISVQGLVPGLYILQATDAQNRRVTARLMVN